MDNILLTFMLSWQFLGLGALLSCITYMCRLGVEFVLDMPSVPASKSSKFWTDVFLPSLPIILGILFGIFVTGVYFPYPQGISQIGSRVIFGSMSGLASGYIFRIIKGVLSKEEKKNSEQG